MTYICGSYPCVEVKGQTAFFSHVNVMGSLYVITLCHVNPALLKCILRVHIFKQCVTASDENYESQCVQDMVISDVFTLLI